jgi:pyruvate formate lyase activating enzyme
MERTEEGAWRCLLCPRGCTWTGSSGDGFCRVRGVRDWQPALPGYGRCVSLSIDPIEKKPLYHFMPGTAVLSTGPAGCNLSCAFCQNWSISQETDVPTRYVPPEALSAMAMEGGSSGIAFTYTEPTVWFEYIVDTAPLVRARGGSVVMVSNGMVNPGPLERLIDVTDAWNVDLKSWSEDFYRRLCGGERDAVLGTLRLLAASRCHLEVTFLLIPGENDDEGDWREMASWLASECGPRTVLHISRYFPRHKLTRPPTPVEALLRARDVYLEKLTYVYLGNVNAPGADTPCPSCGAVCVHREGMSASVNGLDGSRCRACGFDTGILRGPQR